MNDNDVDKMFEEELEESLLNPARQVKFTYKNHAGKVQTRYVVPMHISYGISDWHPEAQWLLNAYDVVKMEERTFAMKDISEWAADEPV